MNDRTSLNTRYAMLRYSLLQAFYWMESCTCTGFVAVFLEGVGADAAAIGSVMGVGNILAFIAQPYLTSKADRSRKISITGILLVMFACLIGAECLTMVPGVPVILVLIAYIAIVTLMQASMPILSGLSVYYTDRGANINFGISRGLGSFTFAVLSTVLGIWVQKSSYRVIGIASIVMGLIVVFLLILMPSPRAVKPVTGTEKKTDAEDKSGSYPDFLRKNPWFTVFIVGMSLALIQYMTFSNFFIQVVENVGGGSSEMGIALALAALVEVPMMFLFNLILKKFTIRTIMNTAILGFLLRSAIMALAVNIGQIYFASCIQFLGYALYIPVTVAFADAYFPEGDKNKALGLLAATQLFGSVVGSLAGGFLIRDFGIRRTMIAFLVLAVAGSLLALWSFGKIKNRRE
ncbi:MAG: MFS transporter [Eubacterium sp.]|nr:MFS transporter [Eubacterium sp.]